MILMESGHANEYPLNHARILYGNVSSPTISATGATANFPAALALTDSTYERWKPATTGDSITLEFPAQNINAIAIAAHNRLDFTLQVRTLNSGFETIKLFRPDSEESLSANMTAQEYGLLDYSPDNQAILMLIKERQLTAIKITVSYTAEAPTIGIFRAGKVLEMMRPFYQGHSPAMLSSNARVQPNVSESGEWLGASLIREGRSLNLAWQNLTADWVRSKWTPFAQYIKTKPYFIAWNPLQFPSDCFYAVSSSVPKPTNSGPRNYQAITLQAQAYSDGSDPIVESLGDKTFSELFDFERNSNATYYDVSGILQTAGANVPRFTYDPVTLDAQGLLIEEARTNLLTDTDNLVSPAWTPIGCHVVPNVAIAPDGKLSADQVNFSATGAENQFFTQVAAGALAGQVYTGSVWVKAATASDVGKIILFRHAASSSYTQITLTADWQRFVLTETAASTSINFQLADRPSLPSGSTDGNISVLVWGVQLEAGSFPTSYMPSTETFTSRASTATFIDSNGDWQLAGVNSERSAAYGYDTNGNLKLIGQLLEEQRTNLFTYPREYGDNSSWVKSRAVQIPFSDQSPLGNFGATKLIENTETNAHFMSKGVSITAGQQYTFSGFFKAGERDTVSIFAASSINQGIEIDLNTGVVTNLSSFPADSFFITPYPNGWYRAGFVFTGVTTAAQSMVMYLLATNFAGRSYTGDGESGAYVWGMQIEQGAYPTSLTPDATSFTSRSTKATYTNSSGLIAEAAIDEERNANYTYDSENNLQLTPTVLEPSRTNSFLWARNLNNGTWVKNNSISIPYATLAPDNTFTATKIITNTSTATHVAYQNVSVTSATKYTFSAFLKAGEKSASALFLGGSTGEGVVVDLNSGEVSLTGAGFNNADNIDSEYYGNGWWRVSAVVTAVATESAAAFIYILNTANFSARSYTGDGASGIYVWGAQLEAGAPATTITPDNTTFTSRSTTATYLDSSGVIQTAAINTARDPAYAYDDNGDLQEIGLLLENASTNLLLYSESFDNAAWAKTRTTISANSTNAPDGNATADTLITDGTAATDHYIVRVISFTSGTPYTISIYAKQKELSQIEIQFPSTAFGATKSRIFDLSNGTTAAGGASDPDRFNIVSAGNGWYRCDITATATATAAGAVIYFLASSGSRTFDGDGTSGLFIWGAQTEAQQYATSYIPTTSGAATRAADVSSSPAFTRGPDVASSPAVTRSADVYTSTALARAADVATRTPGVEFNSRAFTVYVEANYNDNDIEVFFDSNSGATTDDKDRINMYRSSATNNIIGNVKDKFGTSVSRSISSANGPGSAKVALSFDADTGAFILAANGTSSSTTTTIEKIEPSRFVLGARFDLGLYELNDTIKDLKIYGRALTATELEALTA